MGNWLGKSEQINQTIVLCFGIHKKPQRWRVHNVNFTYYSMLSSLLFTGKNHLQGLQKTKITGQRYCNDLGHQWFLEDQGRPNHLKNGSTYSTNEFSFACFTNKHLLIRFAVHCYLVSHLAKWQTIKFNPRYLMSNSTIACRM